MSDFTYTPPGQNSPEHQKRTVIAMILMMGLFLAWNAFFAPPPPPPGASTPEAQTTSDALSAKDAAPASGSSAAALTASAAPQQNDPPPAQSELPVREATFQTRTLDLALSSEGGGISRAVLKSGGGEWADYKFEQVFNLESGRDVRSVDLAKVDSGQHLPGACEVSGDASLPYAMRYALEERTSGVTFRASGSDVSVEKAFDFSDDGYDLTASYRVTNNSAVEKRLTLTVVYPAFYDPRHVPKSSLFSPPPDQIQAILLDDGDGERLQAGKGSEEKTFKGPIQFAGFDQRYFLGAMFPRDQKGTSGRLSTSPDGRYEAALIFDLGRVSAGQTVTREVGFFVGPKSHDLLNKVSEASRQGVLVSQMKDGAPLRFADPRLSESIDFGWWAVICRALLAVLNLFAGFVHNWGAAIVLLTFLVKLILFPLNQRQMESMEAMRRIQPKMQELQKKYANDREKLGMEQMKLFQENHVNPLGGCLPMIVQMPVWFALYRTLYSSFELYREPLFSVWITDLTQSDPYYILPLAMGVTMFITQKMQPQMGDAKQARMMLYFMPAFFTFLMANLPAGLTLYIFTNNLLSIAQQSILRRRLNLKNGGDTAASNTSAVASSGTGAK